MSKKAPFVHKLINKLDKIDRKSLQNYIQELTENQAVLHHILNAAEEGILLLNKDGAISFANDSARDLLSLHETPASKKKGLDWLTDKDLKKYITDNMDHLNDRIVQDISILEPKEKLLRVSLIPLKDSGPSHTLVLLYNDSDQAGPRNWEEKMARIESLVKLAAGIAHEIGNPLNSIGIHLQILKNNVDKLPKEYQPKLIDSIETIDSETSRLDKIIRNFLKATRKTPIRFKTDDINALLEEALHFMQPELEANNVTIEFIKDASVPSFMLDRERLHQAFLNLIKNAIEAMPQGGSLFVGVKRSGKIVRVTFKDTGTGISETHLPYIFDAYFTTKEEGSGLGLMTVFDSVRDHGGRVEAKSQLGKGTAISILIPMRQPKLQLPEYHTKAGES